jgi:hypothetical protein
MPKTLQDAGMISKREKECGVSCSEKGFKCLNITLYILLIMFAGSGLAAENAFVVVTNNTEAPG